MSYYDGICRRLSILEDWGTEFRHYAEPCHAHAPFCKKKNLGGIRQTPLRCSIRTGYVFLSVLHISAALATWKKYVAA